MRLSDATLARVPATVGRPAYDRASVRPGIVHLGVGAFHRAHQAVFTDQAMAARGGDWGIVGVSMRSGRVRDQLEPQDGLFSVTERSGGGDHARIIGAVQRVIVGPEAPGAVAEALASPGVRIVTLTVTEKAYAEDPDGANGVCSYLTAGLALRRARSLPGLTLMSCDNLSDNGGRLANLLADYLDAKDSDLARWFAGECACPSTMVDRIVPATTAADLDRAAAALGLEDQAAVACEPFRQWVIEGCFVGPRPAWEAAGAQFVADVRPYETAKLRMLNGAHSALAYLGLARRRRFVHEAVADTALTSVVESLMREAATSFTPAAGQDLDAYAGTILGRFGNPALPHALAQIAIDGSQKIPQRWLATLADQQAKGRTCPAVLRALAAWLAFVRGDRGPVNDPMAAELARLWASLDAPAVVDALFGPAGIFAHHWTATADDRRALVRLLADAPAG